MCWKAMLFFDGGKRNAKVRVYCFGSQIKVLEPALLRNWHKEALQEALGNYN